MFIKRRLTEYNLLSLLLFLSTVQYLYINTGLICLISISLNCFLDQRFTFLIHLDIELYVQLFTTKKGIEPSSIPQRIFTVLLLIVRILRLLLLFACLSIPVLNLSSLHNSKILQLYELSESA